MRQHETTNRGHHAHNQGQTRFYRALRRLFDRPTIGLGRPGSGRHRARPDFFRSLAGRVSRPGRRGLACISLYRSPVWVLVVLICLGLLPVRPALADDPTPTPYQYPIDLPPGFGPDGAGGIAIVDHGESANVIYTIDGWTQCTLGFPSGWGTYPALCGAAIEMAMDCGAWGGCSDNSVTFKLYQNYEAQTAYIRFGWLSKGPGQVEITSYDTDGVTELDSVAIWRADGNPIDGAQCYTDSSCHDYCWVMMETELTAKKNGYIKFLFPQLEQGYLAGLWIDDNDYNFPTMCGSNVPTRTPTPVTPTPTGAWTPSPTVTPTLTSTPMPTIPGITLTPSATPRPFATWTPSPSPTPWQTNAPTLAAWQITPDASLTPVPTPGAPAPLPTLSPFPTLALAVWPTVETVTPFPTNEPDSTPGSVATAAWDIVGSAPALEAPATDFLDLLALLLEDDIQDQGNVYSATQTMASNMLTPIRMVRGLEIYIPSLFPVIAWVLGALAYVALIQIIKVGLGVSGSVLDVIHKIIDTVLP